MGENRPFEADRPVWLVLGGGALKGLAHIGVWRALSELGVRVEGIVGTSIGAIVGAALATGRTPDDLADAARSLRKKDVVGINPWALGPFGIRQKGLFRGEATLRFVRTFLGGASWKDLQFPLAMNAVDLGAGETVWFGEGGRTDLSLADAAYASSALPGLYPPFESGGRHFVDGGLLETLPVGRAVELGASGVLSVNAGAGREADAEAVLRHGIIGLNQRMFVIMSNQRRTEVLERSYPVPHVNIRPNLSSEDGFAFDRIDYFMEEGYRATYEAVAPNPSGE